MKFELLPDEPLYRGRKTRVEPLSTPEAIAAALRSDPILGEQARELSMGDLATAFRGSDILDEIDNLIAPSTSIDVDPTANPPSPQPTL